MQDELTTMLFECPPNMRTYDVDDSTQGLVQSVDELALGSGSDQDDQSPQISDDELFARPF